MIYISIAFGVLLLLFFCFSLFAEYDFLKECEDKYTLILFSVAFAFVDIVYFCMIYGVVNYVIENNL